MVEIYGEGGSYEEVLASALAAADSFVRLIDTPVPVAHVRLFISLFLLLLLRTALECEC